MPDPLTDVLTLLDGRSVVSTGLRAGGQWSMRVATYEGLKFNAVIEGKAWLRIENGSPPVLLHAGDCFMLVKGKPFVLTTDLALVPRDAVEIFANAPNGVAAYDSSGDFYVVGGKMTLDTAMASLLVDALPDVIHLSADSGRAGTVRWLLSHLVEEAGGTKPGSDAQARLAMQMLFIELIRAYLDSTEQPHPGWLGALGDRRLGRALQAMHDDPVHPWRLADLAQRAGMSRSSFAARFKLAVGVSALDYLIRWRIHLACRELQRPGATVAHVAASFGYSSESAFGNAFKRVFGQAPRRYLATDPSGR